jgi:hypothetical protein
MALDMTLNEHGHLLCLVGERTIATFDALTAVQSMREALDGVDDDGIGECFWAQATGQYRWVFRKEGSRAKVAVTWSSGVVTGWEHVWWADVEWEVFSSELRAHGARIELELSSRSAGRS